MQALLFHNPTAGTGSLTPEGLLSVLREAGYSADEIGRLRSQGVLA